MQAGELEDDVAAETLFSVVPEQGVERRSAKRARSPSPEEFPDGARNFEETFRWGSRFLKRLRQLDTSHDFSAEQTFQKNLQAGVIITSDYSGMGCAEMASKMLSVSAEEEGMSMGEGITCYRCADVDEDPFTCVSVGRLCSSIFYICVFLHSIVSHQEQGPKQVACLWGPS